MPEPKFVVIEKVRFAKKDKGSLAFIKFPDTDIKIYIKKNQTRLQKITYIVHEVWEWGVREILNGVIPTKNERRAIDDFCNKMDKITINLIRPYL